MAKNYWMFVLTPENFAISKGLGFTVHGMGVKYRKRAERMQSDDKVLYYVNGLRKWTVIGSIASKCYEDTTPIWKPTMRGEDFRYRVKIAPGIILDEPEYIDALILAPRLEYLKRWVPETWPLAFMEYLHLLPQHDYRLVESEIRRVVSKRTRPLWTGPAPSAYQHAAQPADDDEPDDESGDAAPLEPESEEDEPAVE
jgi:predicted RNA-binding protein